MELVLHNFAGRYEYNSGYEQRSYREGIAWSHFSPGNVQIPGAPDVLIMGSAP